MKNRRVLLADREHGVRRLESCNGYKESGSRGRIGDFNGNLIKLVQVFFEGFYRLFALQEWINYLTKRDRRGQTNVTVLAALVEADGKARDITVSGAT